MTEDAAIEQAKRAAVEIGIGTVMSSETVVKNSVLFSDNIFAKSTGFVKTFTVTDKFQGPDGLWTITIDAVVTEIIDEILQDELAVQTLLNAMNRPKIIFMIKEQNLIDDKEMKFLWVTDFPLFEKDDNGSWQPAHHVFSSPHEEDYELLNTNPGKVRADLFDLVCNGVELGSGSIRIHDRKLQEKVFDIIGYSSEEVNNLFGHLLEAFDYGVPPHGGMG